MKKITLIAIVILLCSCQTQKKWLRKGYEKGWLSDSTITKYDTIRGFSHDTFIKFDTMNRVDTITTLKNGIKVVTYIKWKEREVTQLLTQKDTILIREYITKVITKPAKWFDKLGVVFGVIAFIILLWVLGYLVKKEND
jgi:hypothetical protein